MEFLKNIFAVLLALMCVCCFGQDCLLTDEIEAQKPMEEGKCYEYTYISNQYEMVKEIEVRKAPNVPEEIEKYEEYVITTRKLVKEAYCDWVEIICEENETPELYYEIKDALKLRGYHWGYPLNHFLSKLQKDLGLPIGNLNIKTMKALRIDYEQFGAEK